MTRLGALLLALVAFPLAAQDARLVFREAAFPESAEWAPPQDTTGWAHAEVDGRPLRLGEELLALGPGDVRYASVAFSPYADAPQISLELSEAAGLAFSEITGNRVGKAIALVLDGDVLMAPTINGRIPNGRVVITGRFTRAEADRVVRQILEVTEAVDGRRARWEALRREADPSTPSGAARAFIAATNERDWLTVARLLHPAATRELRTDMESAVEVHGDSIRARPSGEGERASEGGWIRFSDVLGDGAVTGTFSALQDPEAVALLFAVLEVNPSASSGIVVEGEVAERPDLVHVVLTVEQGDPFVGTLPWMSQARVLTTEQVGDRWVVLVPEAGW